jgi:hypothetical protein
MIAAKHSLVCENGTDLLTLALLPGHSNLNQVMQNAYPSETRTSDAVQLMLKKSGAKTV